MTNKTTVVGDVLESTPTNQATAPVGRFWSFLAIIAEKVGFHSAAQRLGSTDTAEQQPATAASFSQRRKWFTLAILSFVQISMNFNASVYGNAVHGIEQEFHVSNDRALIGQWIFLITYAFGCELWAPWSEDFGRFWVLQGSLWMVNIWQILCARAPSMTAMIIGRALGGLCSAGGSVTLGVVADMYTPAEQQRPVAFVVFFSVMGSIVGPVGGAIIERFIPSFRWIFWVQLILGCAAALVHLFFCPETRSKVLEQRIAHRRINGHNPTSDDDATGEKLTLSKCWAIWTRPFFMFVREPIVLCLSLLSGFSDALIFLFLEAFGEVYGIWNFGIIARGLTFVPLACGYIFAYLFHYVDIGRQLHLVRRCASTGAVPKRGPEEKLRLLLFLGPLEVIGLLGFAFVSYGPSHNIPWAATIPFVVMVGIANYSIYMATIDYMVEAYGPYAASATGGNGFARDLLAGISALYAKPLYRKVGGTPLVYGSLIPACLCVLILVPLYGFFFFGPWFRQKSHFSRKIVKERETRAAHQRELDEKTGVPAAGGSKDLDGSAQETIETAGGGARGGEASAQDGGFLGRGQSGEAAV